MAGDLRTVAALLHVIKHAERMGDQCVNIAKMLPLVGHEPPADAELLEQDLPDGRGSRAPRSRRPSRRSLLRDVVARARTSCVRTRRSTGSTASVFRRAVEIGTDADRREWAMTMMLVARALERIGDNAVDIGEQVAFVVTGLFREFSDASHV